MTQAAKTYTARMIVFAVTYTVAIFGVNWIDGLLSPGPAVRVPLALVPVLPALFMVFAVVAFVRAMDEVQARVVTESVLIAAMVVSLASFTYGMLRGAVELPPLEAYWYLPALIAAAGVAQIFVSRRYQ